MWGSGLKVWEAGGSKDTSCSIQIDCNTDINGNAKAANIAGNAHRRGKTVKR